MPYSLLIRLDGPMQAWGVDSRFGIRETRREPSKSGVLGLVAAALGRPRHADMSDLAALDFGVRVDREGLLLRDFHTAGKSGYLRASGTVERKNVIVSERYYLADACFTVALGAPTGALLQTIRSALLAPHWPLFLGRRAFPMAAPAILTGHAGLVQQRGVLDALRAAPLPSSLVRDGDLRFVLDGSLVDVPPDGRQGLAGPDAPISFGPRQFANRETYTIYESASRAAEAT